MRSSNLLTIALLLALAAPCAAASAQAQQGADVPEQAAPLRPGDVVRLKIWREPDLSGDYTVDEKGTVTFPKLGPMTVDSTWTATLRDTLVARYQRYLRNPSIEVVFLRRVNVLGAVMRPGVYPVDPTLTISDVLALAGGATPDGNRSRAELLRDGERVRVRLAASDRVADLHLRSGDQLFVPERSWFSRNQGILAATISATVSILIALSR